MRTRYRVLGWVAVIGLALCVVSIAVLTVMLPGDGSYPGGGGFLPITSPGR